MNWKNWALTHKPSPITDTLLAIAFIVSVLLLAGCGGGGTPSATPTPTVTTTPTPSVTRNEEGYLAKMAGQQGMDSATKVAIGNTACDQLEAGTNPQDLRVTVGTAIDTYAEAYRFGEALAILCPTAN